VTRVLLVDNYDSFTYNLVQLVEEAGAAVTVVKNDEVDFGAVETFDKILLSPGPGLPAESGRLLPLIREFSGKKSILGVCLGHQAIAEVFGGRLVNLERVYHGIRQEITLGEDLIFREISGKTTVGLYHSWAVAREGFPPELQITAESPEGVIMALRHRRFDVRGVQFHPESYMTGQGARMMRNWVNKDDEP
jgi:anthranilate synthase component 2